MVSILWKSIFIAKKVLYWNAKKTGKNSEIYFVMQMINVHLLYFRRSINWRERVCNPMKTRLNFLFDILFIQFDSIRSGRVLSQ